MSRSVGDINAKLAYITNRATGPILKIKRPMLVNNPKFPKHNTRSEVCENEMNDLLECINMHEDNSSCSDLFSALLKCTQNNAKSMKNKEKTLLAGKPVAGKYHPRIARKIALQYPEKLDPQGLKIQRNKLNTHTESRTKLFPFEDKGRPFNK